MSFFQNLADNIVSFANDSAKTVVREVVDPTVSFANNSARTVVEEVVNPTVSFANNAAQTVVEEVVNPTVSFANNSARTVAQEVINPTVTFIESQIQRPRDVIEQQETLDKLQESNGSHFPGDDYIPTDRKNWMAHLSTEKLTLNKIVWPGTHDSATNGIGDPLVGRALAECQTLSVYDQLSLGTRVLDIRVQANGKICHGIITSYDVDFVLYDVMRFVSDTRSEIVVLEIRTEHGHRDPPDFGVYLTNKLGPFLIHQDDNLFDKPLSEILPRRIICIWKPRESTAKPSRGGPLWNSDYLKDNWTDTDLPLTKFDNNMKYLKMQVRACSRKFFYRVENTLTPQADNPVLWVRPVTDRIRNYARLFIARCVLEGCVDKLQILSTDFIDVDFVDACVGLTRARIDGRV